MTTQEKIYKCENCHTRNADRYNETVRDRNSKIAKIMNICNHCWLKITGAK